MRLNEQPASSKDTYGVEGLINFETSRMLAFRELSECYFLPDTGLLEKLENLELYMATVCESAVGFVQSMRRELEAGTGIEPLKVEFSKLFVGPYKILAAPYGSIYLDDGRQVMGESTLDVKRRYREAGLIMSKDFKDAPDHITAELEFMCYLIFKELDAFANTDNEAVIGFVQTQKSFLDHHIMAWVPTFNGNIIEHAETMFYQNLAKATETFLKEDYHVVCSIIDSGKLNSENRAINEIHHRLDK